MIADVLIVLVAVVVLTGIIGVCAWRYLREDNKDESFRDVSMRPGGDRPSDTTDHDGPQRTAARRRVHGYKVPDWAAGAAHGERRGEPSTTVRSDQRTRLSVAPDLAEPSDGDSYATQLRAIRLAADSDVLRLELAWYPGRMPAWVSTAGLSLEDWHRCYTLTPRQYMRDRERDARVWARQVTRDRDRWLAEMGVVRICGELIAA